MIIFEIISVSVRSIALQCTKKCFDPQYVSSFYVEEFLSLVAYYIVLMLSKKKLFTSK
jgi:hypothetical protein